MFLLIFVAIAFGYYDCLLKIGDRNKFHQEEARLKSLRNTIALAGYQLDMLEEFEDAALDLLKDTAKTLGSPDSESKLVEAFNDEFIQNYVITYFRVRISPLLISILRLTFADAHSSLDSDQTGDLCTIRSAPQRRGILHQFHHDFRQ